MFKTARSVTDKECVRCNKKIFDVDATTKYCNECRELVNDEFYKNNYERRKSRRNELKNTEEKLIDNFLNIVKEDYQLTPAGFNEVSEISSFSYQNYYRISWLEILKKFGKSQQMIDYILKEYKIFVSTGYQDFKKFVKEHKYVSEALIKHVGRDKLREFANVRVRRNTDDDYKNNFLNIMKQLGHIPLFHEFLEISCIKPNSYANRFNLKGKVYDNIVKLYVSEDEYNKYLIQKRIHKSEVGTETGKLALKYTDEFLIEEYKRVFNFCLNEYGTLPTNDLFNELSITDDSMYRKRFEMSWADFGRKLGYKIEKTSNKSEKTALEVVKSIINEDYDPQKKFDWLIGVKDFPLFCDGYFPKHNLVVEFDGRQHREPIERYGGMEMFHVIKANDKFKDVLIPRNGLTLIRISSEEPFWNKEYIENKLIKNGITI